MNFSEKDLKQIAQKGLTLAQVNSQIEIFKKGVPAINLKEAATKKNGILRLDKEKKQHYINVFEDNRNAISILKFVPASGLATRMFKMLFQFLEEYQPNNGNINSYINKNEATDLSAFLVGLEKLPFFDAVIQKINETLPDFNTLSFEKQSVLFIKAMLDEDKLNYAACPKGLLPFHKYKTHVSTAFEAHLYEAALYASSNNEASLHFTLSKKHHHKFNETFKNIEKDIQEKTKTKFNISFSYQKQSTDTIAVTLNNEPLRDENGNLIFRPSGHGALIENLNNGNADIVFIKNIDNVVTHKYKEEVSQYKKILGGVLLEIQRKAFSYLQALENANLAKYERTVIAEFLSRKMNVSISEEFKKYSSKDQISYLRETLNRPIRVCGMVKNEGESGGGPFWVTSKNGNVSLQIVEAAQIDKNNKHQKKILKSATHFNPVDLVCGIKNYKGETFNLTAFVDSKTAFITRKTKGGKDLKALELPGLWNGGMANWNTIFVEVPLISFNPVKTVNDLLKAAHQIT